MVPHLITANSGPIFDLERKILDAMPAIERWLRLQWQDHTPPFYGSVDLRNAGFKLAPVDLNLFPGGFNNLSDNMLPLAVQAAQTAIDHFCCDAMNLLIIPERHTRNGFYLRNVARLVTILRQTGLHVRLGSLDPLITAPTDWRVDGVDVGLVIEPLVRTGSRLGLKDFDPCAILLNNDLSAGTPDILKGLQGQHLLPPLHAGWTVRRKSTHFAAYDRVVQPFAATLGIDPWLLNPYFTHRGGIDFHARVGEEDLADAVDALLKKIAAKYREHGVADAPFVIMKADAGTYGMGVMSVKSPDDVRDLNRKARNKMAVVKDGLQVSDVLLQEGVHTIERVPIDGRDGVAEPVVYMIDRHVVGGFYRVHAERGVDENLNAPGMQFVPLPFDGDCNMPDCAAPAGAAAPNRFYMYGVVARLSLLAASVELEMTDPAHQPATAAAPTTASAALR